jgi:tetratricopeptide (TPR) repeat protein
MTYDDTTAPVPPRESRLARLISYLHSDPANRALLADAAEAALDENRPQDALDLLSRSEALGPLPPRETNLRGVAALQLRLYDRAAAAFESLVAAGVDGGAIRSNLAWARAMAGDREGALALLGDGTGSEVPDAAMLEVQLLHDRGDFEAAAAKARLYLDRHPDHPGLNAAASVLALDVEDAELAARAARAGGDHPDALTTLGTLALGSDRPETARDLFDRALAQNEGVPRAWIGRGLSRMLSGDKAGAPADIDRGAEMFGDHLGSWIAAGWAHFVAGDIETARRRFETALSLDATFGETHGSLAVVDLLQGRVEDGRKKAETALRLDRESASAAFARTLLAAGAGKEREARRIFEAALETPVDRQGRTLGQAMARMGLS